MAKRPTAAQLRARALFAARFGGRKLRGRVARTRNTHMARKSKGRGGFRGRIGRKLDTNALLSGALAGAAIPYASRFSPDYGPAIATGAVGVVMGNPTLQTLAGLQLGTAIISGRTAGAAVVPGVLA